MTNVDSFVDSFDLKEFDSWISATLKLIIEDNSNYLRGIYRIISLHKDSLDSGQLTILFDLLSKIKTVNTNINTLELEIESKITQDSRVSKFLMGALEGKEGSEEDDG